MLKKIYSTLLLALAAGTVAFAQLGTLKGKAIDDGNGEGIPFANVQLEAGGAPVAKTVADIDGNFTIKAIQPGKYDLKVAFLGYAPLMVEGIVIGADKTTYQDMKIKPTATEIKTFEKVEWAAPLVDPDTKSGGNVTREQFAAMPSKDINSVASTTAGVFQSDEGGSISVRGGRQNTGTAGSPLQNDAGGSTKYIIDGVPTSGTVGLPQSAIEQVSVITGGIPAQYGDATGGIINITTRGGIRPDYYGQVELVSSQLTDPYGYNYGNFSLGGPLVSKKDSSGKVAKIGFFLSGDVSSEKDPSPSWIGAYKVKDEKLAELEQHPLSLQDNGSGLTLNSNYVTMDDMEHIKARQNVGRNSARVDGKVDYQATKNIKLTLGGSIDYGNYRDFIFAYSLFNPGNNGQYIYSTKRIFGKITHKLGRQHAQGETTTSVIQNAYYTLQIGYSNYKETLQAADHKDNFFDYGYVGKFQTLRNPVYALVVDTVKGNHYNQIGWQDSAVLFTAGTANPLAVNYTNDFYNLMGTPQTLTDIQPYGMLNGNRPTSPYSLFNNTGREYPNYHNYNYNQLRLTGTFSADIKNHNIQAGIDYERKSQSQWIISPVGLWTQARLLANKHLSSLSQKDSTLTSYNGQDAYTHPYEYTESQESHFGKALRDELGVAQNEWVDIDNLDPSSFSLSMYSPDELLNNGSNYVSYNGYSYDGQKLKGTKFDMAALESFYKKKDADSNYTREIPAFQPIYIAGYIQDKFDIKDMKFNVGLRVDAFNANQPVLQDKYLMYEAYKVSEDSRFTHPTNMGPDYVIYVDDAKNPNKIVGYRNGDDWYDALGKPVADPTVVIAHATSTGSIQPYLKYPKENFLEESQVSNVFKMYKTQITPMPRIAFSFPISKEANFFAHYDVLTQRPPSNIRFDPTNYQFIQSLYSIPIANPDLKPEKTTDYELGFTQVLNERKNAALTITAFYREMRDQLQRINVSNAYPASYITYGNRDFGNVKGFTVAYDLRRTGNSSLTASYTLQFAEGTGSGANSAYSVIASGQPNLRTTNPLDFDQRHAVVLNYDYRFGSGKDYRGPQAGWAKAIFENFGGNVIARAGSGAPYSRLRNVVSGNGNDGTQVITGLNQSSTLEGNVNGSNLPWQYRIDLRLDKNFQLTWNKKSGEKTKKSNLTVYILVLNLLNTQNILNVYRHTGDPNDDGYLSYPGNQGAINGQISSQAFIDQYNAKLGVPTNYSIPRRTRIGVTLNF
jgi:hypothetical protein